MHLVRDKDGLGQEVRAYAQLLIDSGFLGYEDYHAAVVRQFAEAEISRRQERQFDRLLKNLYETRLREQRAWDATTGERLTAAFAALREQGIAGYQFLGENQAQGNWYARATRDVLECRGYCYFTQRDARQPILNGILPLSFGSYAQTATDQEDEAIAREVATTLVQFGFAVAWAGVRAERMVVTTPNWRRRLEPNAQWLGVLNDDVRYEPKELAAKQRAVRDGNPNAERGYVLLNAEREAAEHPATFKIPDEEWRTRLWVGEGLKLAFIPLEPERYSSSSERMWVRLVDMSDFDYLVGELCNEPVVLTHLQFGELVRFRPENIIDVHSLTVGERLN